MTTEVWLPVFGYEGLYEVSDLGRVKRLGFYRKGIFFINEMSLKLKNNKHGYVEIHLHKNGTTEYKKVHRLVCEAFTKNTENKPQVNHINGIKIDNRAVNLEWCTASENVQHRYSKLGHSSPRKGKLGKYSRCNKEIIQYDLIGNIIRKWESSMDINRELGFNTGSISRCCTGKRLTAYGYKWKHKPN